MRKTVTLYNVMFPIFFLLILPQVWPVLLPANLAIDALVVYLTLRSMDMQSRFKPFWKKEMWLVWVLGFVSDLLGAGALIGLSYIPAKSGGSWEIVQTAISQNPFANTTALLLVFLAILLSAAAIYLLNLWITFKKTDMELRDKRNLCLSIALFTAPYTFLIPTQWLYALLG